MPARLSEQDLDEFFARVPSVTVAVVGDLFLDRYFDIDSRLTEMSLETGLDAYQVVRTRECPGAAGTVTNNLASLGVGRILPVAFVGIDPEGWALCRALEQSPGLNLRHVLRTELRRTPTYMKPLVTNESPPRELNRLDIKNRTPTPPTVVRDLARHLDEAFDEADVVVAVDQVQEPECGVLGVALRERLCELAVRRAKKPVLVESRERLGKFHNVILHGNTSECTRALAELADTTIDADASSEWLARTLAEHSGCPVICTAGPDGLVLCTEDGTDHLPAISVPDPIDTVGAGDSVLAAVAAGLAVGWPLRKAALLGIAVASITIRKLGETGTATPDELYELVRTGAWSS